MTINDHISARSIISGMAAPAILLSDGCAAITFNESFAKMLGQSPRAMTHHLLESESALDIIKATPAIDPQLIKDALSSGDTQIQSNLILSKSTNQQSVVDIRIIPVVDELGTRNTILLIFCDKQQESKIRANFRDMLIKEQTRAEELERKMNERTSQLANALEEVTRLSRTDELTGLLNRRAFTEHADHAIRVAKRYDRMIGLLMCDLDHFKRLNDTHGHLAGDAMLKAVSSELKLTLRATDTIGRYGGEEFIVLLPETRFASIMTVADRCVQAVRSIEQIRNEDNPYAKTDKEPQTISIGVAMFPYHGANLDELISSADTALYEAKRRGRNQAQLYTTELDSGPRPFQNEIHVLLIMPNRVESEALLPTMRQSFRVHHAKSISEALGRCSRSNYDIVVSAIDPRRSDGKLLLQRIRYLSPGTICTVLGSKESFTEAFLSEENLMVSYVLDQSNGNDLVVNQIKDALTQSKEKRKQLPGLESLGQSQKTNKPMIEKILAEKAVTMIFQPIQTPDRTIFGYESLCRVNESFDLGPEPLFDAASQHGLIWELGRIIRESVFENLSQLQPDCNIFVNLHPAELIDEDLLSGNDPTFPFCDRIVFEITERAAVPNVSRFVERVRTLREIGYRIAIDDFGAGYANFNSISQLLPDYIKVDRTLTHGIHSSLVKQNLVKSLIFFSKSQRIETIAEGIENENDFNYLKDLGLDYFQGYWIGRPAAADTH